MPLFRHLFFPPLNTSLAVLAINSGVPGQTPSSFLYYDNKVHVLACSVLPSYHPSACDRGSLSNHSFVSALLLALPAPPLPCIFGLPSSGLPARTRLFFKACPKQQTPPHTSSRLDRQCRKGRVADRHKSIGLTRNNNPYIPCNCTARRHGQN